MSALSLLRRPAFGRSVLLALTLAAAALPIATHTAASASAKVAMTARPDFQLPFPCGQQWRLDTWAHSPALDMVKEPNQVGTEGAPFVAAAGGRVVQSFFHSNAGNMIQIDHGGGWFTTGIHLQSRAVGVGAVVSKGQVIGAVGRTGPTSNNHPHLHFEQAFDSNGDGVASWGAAGTERVSQVFNGATYGTANNQTYRNVNSCGGTQPPPPPAKYYVDTFAAAPGYSTPGGTRTGTLNAGTNYVFCKVWGPIVQVGSAYNHWWLKTDLDSGSPWQNQYVSAYYLTRWGNDEAKDNNGVVIRDC
ncbi:M23 family metallopeptidase [Acrocarpospora sp. B8E8]|uniref:M23 family metallopeptidase n=1 Tax=Acrocarpospora sp. B8E8 TaxID=3153572 RepID=UPI00325ED1AB